MADKQPTLLLGRENWRHKNRLFGLHAEDRMQHLYVVGQTGTGKTTLLQNLIWQDVVNGEGLAFFDPHGDAAGELLAAARRKRGADLLYFDVSDPDLPLGFNPLVGVPQAQHALASSGMVEAFRNIWKGNAWGVRLEHILRNALMTLMAQPYANLADLNRLFADKEYRKQALSHLEHPPIVEFWTKEFASYSPRYRTEALAPLWNKLGAFLAQPPLYRVLTGDRPSLSPRQVVDEGKVLLINLAKGRIGADGANLLGSLMVSSFALAGLSRADQPEALRRPFYLYLDEFHNFSTLAFADMLSELRKYKSGLVLAHQYSKQLSEELRHAILGNVGSVLSLRVGPEDAGILQRIFKPDFDAEDLTYLPNHDCYVRLLCLGEAARPFSARTLAPLWPRE